LSALEAAASSQSASFISSNVRYWHEADTHSCECSCSHGDADTGKTFSKIASVGWTPKRIFGQHRQTALAKFL